MRLAYISLLSERFKLSKALNVEFLPERFNIDDSRLDSRLLDTEAYDGGDEAFLDRDARLRAVRDDLAEFGHHHRVATAVTWAGSD